MALPPAGGAASPDSKACLGRAFFLRGTRAIISCGERGGAVPGDSRRVKVTWYHHGMGRRRRIITRVIVFLLLIVGGAIVNVAVAWGCVRWMQRSPTLESPSTQSIETWREYWSRSEIVRRFSLIVTDNPQKTFQRKYRFRYARPSDRMLEGFGVEQGIHSCTFVDDDLEHWLGAGLEIRAGWPLRALHGSAIYDRALPNKWRSFGVISVGKEKAVSLSGDVEWHDLPRIPIWPGFAINTLFYAGILWLLFAAPLALRRWWGARRIKRGLCPACAYPVGNSPRCTECGAALKLSRAT
jgi:hypothetical protein